MSLMFVCKANTTWQKGKREKEKRDGMEGERVSAIPSSCRQWRIHQEDRGPCPPDFRPRGTVMQTSPHFFDTQ